MSHLPWLVLAAGLNAAIQVLCHQQGGIAGGAEIEPHRRRFITARKMSTGQPQREPGPDANPTARLSDLPPAQ